MHRRLLLRTVARQPTSSVVCRISLPTQALLTTTASSSSSSATTTTTTMKMKQWMKTYDRRFHQNMLQREKHEEEDIVDDDEASTADVGNDDDAAAADVAVEVMEELAMERSSLTPKQVVEELDKYIVGQNEAKRAVAIAMRNRWRRNKLAPEMREEVIPKNILMIGPTGVGKTEIARRIAKLSHSPFVKVEATKFTEVGFHGRDVDSIIRDLVEVSIQQTRTEMKKSVQDKAAKAAEEKILDALVGDSSTGSTREQFRQMLQQGDLDSREIEIDVPEKSGKSMSGSPLDDMVPSLGDLFSRLEGFMPRQTKRRKMKIEKCRPLIEEAETDKLLNVDAVNREALKAVENDGIVVIDEIDKICTSFSDSRDASAEGVQRDLLPLIEGTVINTKYGNVKTDHILFICSGAFHSVKPADMLAELQGRLPIRVELKGLTEADLLKILTEPVSNLLQQNIDLLLTEDVEITFEEDAIKEIARVATEINSTVQNIGARRLHTVVEKIIEDISFDAPSMKGKKIGITKQRVEERVESILRKSDLSKFVL